MKKEIVITGVAGFIGYSVAKRLLDLGYTIIGIDNLNDYYDVSLKEYRLKILRYYKDKFVFYKEDIINKPAMEVIFTTHDPEKVLHLAAQAGVRYSITNPEVYIDTNLVGFSNILELTRNRAIPLVYASSSSVYGSNTEELCSERHDTSNPVSLYGATKKANEVMAHSYSHLYKLPTIGLRFFTVYGPWGRPDMALQKFTRNILAGEQIDVYNNGEMYRDFTFINDIVDGVLAALGYDISTRTLPYDIFNLGCGDTRKLIDFVSIIEENCGKKAEINYMPLQPGDVPKTSADISKAKVELGFNPKVQIEEGVDRFVNWYKSYYNKES